MKKGDYIICRTASAGVFAGTLVSRKGKEVELKNARRLWYWDGAATVTPQTCKCSCEVPAVLLAEAIALLPVVLLTEAIELLPVSKAVDHQSSVGGCGNGNV
jgi:hypothetical protein